jgi:hypothetical protein
MPCPRAAGRTTRSSCDDRHDASRAASSDRRTSGCRRPRLVSLAAAPDLGRLGVTTRSPTPAIRASHPERRSPTMCRCTPKWSRQSTRSLSPRCSPSSRGSTVTPARSSHRLAARALPGVCSPIRTLKDALKCHRQVPENWWPQGDSNPRFSLERADTSTLNQIFTIH